jgi:hypothetical protein
MGILIPYYSLSNLLHTILRTEHNGRLIFTANLAICSPSQSAAAQGWASVALSERWMPSRQGIDGRARLSRPQPNEAYHTT